MKDNEIPTAEEFMNSEQYEPDLGIFFEDYYGDAVGLIPSMMIEFAKLHVTEALRQASEVRINSEFVGQNQRGASSISYSQNVKGILNAYPLDNIK
jgi:hypothetical protein